MNKNLLLWNGESYFAEKNDAHFTQFLRSWRLKISKIPTLGENGIIIGLLLGHHWEMKVQHW